MHTWPLYVLLALVCVFFFVWLTSFREHFSLVRTIPGRPPGYPRSIYEYYIQYDPSFAAPVPY